METNIYQESYRINGTDESGLIPKHTQRVIVSYAFDGSVIENISFCGPGGGQTGEEPKTREQKKRSC